MYLTHSGSEEELSVSPTKDEVEDFCGSSPTWVEELMDDIDEEDSVSEEDAWEVNEAKTSKG